jgi:hypothetical protein
VDSDDVGARGRRTSDVAGPIGSGRERHPGSSRPVRARTRPHRASPSRAPRARARDTQRRTPTSRPSVRASTGSAPMRCAT